jgi:flavin-dependent dehydrogenase
MQPQIQVAIIGGGLAGLTAAIHLRQKGYIVTLFEKNDYPKHKVCGEFISNEVLPYWESLGVEIQKLQPTTLTQTVISIPTGKQLETVLPLGGFGISRYTLDNYLYTKAKEAGCQLIQQQVNAIEFLNDSFTKREDFYDFLFKTFSVLLKAPPTKAAVSPKIPFNCFSISDKSAIITHPFFLSIYQ